MKEIINKMINLQLGILSVTRDKISAVVEELVRLGEVSRDEGRKLIDEYVARGEKSRQELRSEIEKMVTESVRRNDLVLRRELEQLKLEVQELKKELRQESLEHAFNERKGI